jgi:hypothetical protein
LLSEVEDDPATKKIILTRGRRVVVSGRNVSVMPMLTPEGQYHAVRARFVFVNSGPRVDLPLPLSPNRHRFIHLRDGVNLARTGFAAPETLGRPGVAREEHRRVTFAVVASGVDRLAATAALHPLAYDDMWDTGVPRHDFLLRREDRLPQAVRADLASLRDLTKGRRLALLLPAPRDDHRGPRPVTLDRSELAWLAEWCDRTDTVIGVRDADGDLGRPWFGALREIGALDLSSRHFADLSPLLREADVVVASPYRTQVVDFLLTGRPVVILDEDKAPSPWLVDLAGLLPGPVVTSFEQCCKALDVVFDPRDPAEISDYLWKRRMLLSHTDDQNSARLVGRVKATYRCAVRS